MRYGDLAADPAGTTLRILDLLGLAPPRGRTVVARHRRQADALTGAWIARHRMRTAGN